MTFLPIVARELRVASRRPATYWGRLWAALVAILIAGFWLPVANSVSTSQGQVLFGTLAGLGFVYCLLAGARVTSDCISAEKREGTIGLLFLTDLKGYDVVLGKLISCSLNALYGLVALVPVLALALLLGGVTLGEVERMALLFLTTMLLSLSAGVLASTLSRNDRRAMFATVCIVIAVTGVPYTLASVLIYVQILANGNPSFAQYTFWLKPSPAFAFHMTTTAGSSRALISDFYESIVATLGIAGLLLAAASLLVPKVCRERPRSRWQERWLTFRNRWNYGAPTGRRVLQRRLLDRNAFFWLAGRDRAKGYYVWAFLGTLGLIWGWMIWFMGGFDWQLSVILLFVTFAFLKMWVASEICSRLVEDRESGVFEVLLASPLQPGEIARGQRLALTRQFGLPVLACVGGAWLLMGRSVNSWHGDVASGEVRLVFWALVGMLLADLVALRWVAAWHALKSAQIQKAALGACARIQLLPTVVFVVVYNIFVLWIQAGDIAGLKESAFAIGTLLWLSIGLLNAAWFGIAARWHFLRQFRHVAAERYAPRMPALEPFVELIRGFRTRLRPGKVVGEPGVTASWRWGRVCAALLVGALLAVPIAFLVWKHTLHRGVEAELEAVKAARLPLTLAELDDWGPLVPDDQNASLVIQKAMWKARGLPPTPRGVAGAGKLEWPQPLQSLPPAQQARVTAWVTTNREALILLETAAAMPNCRHHVFWGQTWPSAAMWQTFGRIGTFSEVLPYDALLRCDADDVPGALQCVHTMLGLAHALSQDPLLAAQTHRRNFLAAAVRVTERILNRHALTADQLQLLRRRFREAELATPNALARAFVGERCLFLAEDRALGRQSPFLASAPSGLPKLQAEAVEFIGEASGFRDYGRRQYLVAIRACITNATHLAAGASPDLYTASDASASRVRPIGRTQVAAMEFYWKRFLLLELEGMARLRLVQTALALEESRSRHGSPLPDALGNLRDLEGETGRDPFLAGPLHYVRLQSGYLLYSVGQDRLDDLGNDPGPNSRPPTERRDIAFRVGR